MKRNIIETVLGAVVLVGAALFFMYGYKTANVKPVTGYEVVADFSGIGGLKPGDNVEISGVKVGTVTSVELNPQTYLARVHMNVADGIRLPTDTAALISSESLLGGRYLSLEPGADEEMIEAGGRIEITQAPQNLEQLLGKFIFSMQDDKKGGDATAQADTAPQPAPAATPEPAPMAAPVTESVPDAAPEAPAQTAPEAAPPQPAAADIPE